MKTKQALLQTPEYWTDELQNEIYRQVADYMRAHQLNQNQLAEKLGFSKGYISQILNGNCNFTLKKIVELSLKLGKAPVLQYVPLENPGEAPDAPSSAPGKKLPAVHR